jgi:hypothetical protein
MTKWAMTQRLEVSQVFNHCGLSKLKRQRAQVLEVFKSLRADMPNVTCSGGRPRPPREPAL